MCVWVGGGGPIVFLVEDEIEEYGKGFKFDFEVLEEQWRERR